MAIRGTRTIYPPKRAASKPMFTGADASQPHAELQREALLPGNSSIKAGKVSAPSQQSLRHQAPKKGY